MVERVPEPSGDASPGNNGPPWEPLPDGLTLAPGIDLDSPDPALLDGRRRCVSTRQAGGRCGATAMNGALLCPIHAGLADPATAARALADKRRLAQREAEDRVAERKLGLRGALSAQLRRESAKVEAAVQHLLDAAANGDLKAAQALLPWLDQAFGKAAGEAQESPAHRLIFSELPTDQLAEIVAAGRARRLAVVAQPDDGEVPPRAAQGG